MHKIHFQLVVVLAAILSVAPAFGAGSSKSKSYSIQDLQRGGSLPRPLPARINKGAPYIAVACGMKSLKHTEQSSRLLSYLYKKGRPEFRTFYHLMLGDTLMDLDQDPAAYRTLSDFQKLPNNTLALHNVKWLPKNVAGMKNYSYLLQARILARNGHEKEALAALAKVKPGSGYEHMWVGEVYFLLGKDTDAMKSLGLAVSRPGGHPENNWAAKFIPMHAVNLAARMGRDAEAKKWGARIRNRGINAEKWPQWKCTWSIVDKTLQYPKQDKIDIRKLRSGTYDGVCRGFVQDIRVKVRIASGKLTSVSITSQKESRAYSAMEIIPKRIVNKQSVRVDAISGATLSSDAISAATVEALMKAKK